MSTTDKQEKIFAFLERQKSREESAALLYVLRSWKRLSEAGEITNPALTFEAFDNSEITVQDMVGIFGQLADHHKIFDHFLSLYSVATIVDDTALPSYVGLVRSAERFPDVCEIFCSEEISKHRGLIVSDSIARLGAALLEGDSSETYVPFCNGIAAVPYLEGKIWAESVSLYGAFVAEAMRILGKREIVYSVTDPLEHPAYHKPEASHQLRMFDRVLAFPPLGIRRKIDTANDPFGRFHRFRGQSLDAAYLDHVLSQMSGRAVILLPVGFAYRTGVEEAYRQYLIENNWLDAVIQLPPNLLYGTGIEALLLIIDKHKSDDRIFFVNLNQEAFLARRGRQTVLKDAQSLAAICLKRSAVPESGLSALIDRQTLVDNHFILSIDRYLLSQETQEIRQALSIYPQTTLGEYAQVRRSQLFKDEENGEEVYELSPTDFAEAGYTMERGKIRYIDTHAKKFETYKLQPCDILLSTKGTIGKAAIVGEITRPMIASQASHIIRIDAKHDRRLEAIALYMFLKSSMGQTLLRQLVSGTVMPQISTSDLKAMMVPLMPQQVMETIAARFAHETDLLDEIEALQKKRAKIHQNFLGDLS